MTHQQRVVIENYHGEKLVGILHDTGSKELVIVCHGFQSWKVVNCDILNLRAFHFQYITNGDALFVLIIFHFVHYEKYSPVFYF